LIFFLLYLIIPVIAIPSTITHIPRLTLTLSLDEEKTDWNNLLKKLLFSLDILGPLYAVRHLQMDICGRKATKKYNNSWIFFQANNYFLNLGSSISWTLTHLLEGVSTNLYTPYITLKFPILVYFYFVILWFERICFITIFKRIEGKNHAILKPRANMQISKNNTSMIWLFTK
jgi:hypothetical protein